MNNRLSLNSTAKSTSWVTSTKVLPPSTIDLRTLKKFVRAGRSISAKDSSIRIRFFACANANANQALCISPADMSVNVWCYIWAIPHESRSFSTAIVFSQLVNPRP